MRKIFLLIFTVFVCTVISSSDFVLAAKLFPETVQVFMDNEELLPFAKDGFHASYRVPKGFQHIILQAQGYEDKHIYHVFDGNISIEDKLERSESALVLVGEFPTGKQPKSVSFSPDGKRLYIPLLDDNGVEVFSMDTLSFEERLSPEANYAAQKGFVESAFRRGPFVYYVSQMTSGRVHLFNEEGRLIHSTNVVGGWPKVISIDEKLSGYYVSNWIEKSVSFIPFGEKDPEKKVVLPGVPRGLCLDNEENTLWVSDFSSGDLHIIDRQKFELIHTIDRPAGAARHLVSNSETRTLYVSDMARGTVSAIDMKTRKVLVDRYIGPNLNTLALSSDGKFLFVSSRGTNNPETYLKKGPDFGKITVLHTRDLTVADWIWGRNQPTGLAVSPDDKYLAITDFLDNNLEIYDISSLWTK